MNSEADKIREAIKFYRENKDKFKPVLEEAETLFKYLRKDKDNEADKMITGFETVAKMRKARAAVEKEIADNMAMADTISFLGLIVKLIAQARLI